MFRPLSTPAAALALSLALAFVLAGSSTATAARRNLLANPGFEESLDGHPWMPTAWDTSITDLPSVFFGRDTFLVERGRYAIGVANVSTLIPLAHNWSQSLLVGREAWGKDAVLTVWTRSNGLQGRAFILLQAYRDTVTRMAKTWGVPRDTAMARLRMNTVDDPLLDLGWRRQYFSETETGWVRRQVRVFVPPGVNVLFVRLGIAGTGQVLFDDVSLTLENAQPAPTPRLHTNLMRDPGFEGDGNDWEYSVPPYEGIEVVRDSSVSRSGRASIRMRGGLGGLLTVRTGVGQSFPMRSLAGKRVRFSAHVKTDSLQGVAYILIYAHTLGGPRMQPTPKQFSMNTDWELTTTEMDLPPDTYEVWVWCVYNAPATGRLYFDDCSFEVLGPATRPARARPR